jgi:hypothetical protein
VTAAKIDDFRRQIGASCAIGFPLVPISWLWPRTASVAGENVPEHSGCAPSCLIMCAMSTMSPTGKAAAHLSVASKHCNAGPASAATLDALMHRSLPSVTRVPVAYCRVSSTAAKTDLKRRILEEFCAARGTAMSRLSSWRRPQSQRPKFMALMVCEGVHSSPLFSQYWRNLPSVARLKK